MSLLRLYNINLNLNIWLFTVCFFNSILDGPILKFDSLFVKLLYFLRLLLDIFIFLSSLNYEYYVFLIFYEGIFNKNLAKRY